jgi:glycerol-3-phosphate dehydrogenase
MPLIHGDLPVLERRALLRVRAALRERDIWLRTAPHLVRPMRFVIPAGFDHAISRPRCAGGVYDGGDVGKSRLRSAQV